jgi:glycosyltransferase involved in cell wall biosynthesis
MTLRVAVVLSHPIPYFASWHREVAKLNEIELKVFFCCDWGLDSYVDPQFQVPIEWDVPLLEGYEHEFLRIRKRPTALTFWEVDNPDVGQALDRFDPAVVQVFGYAHRTNWRAAAWTSSRRRPLLLFSDSNAGNRPAWWKMAAKRLVVRRFYDHVDGALFVSTNNLEYHVSYGLTHDRLFPCPFPIERSRLLGDAHDIVETRLRVRRQLEIPEDAFVVMYCGKYVRHKRPLDLVTAAWEAAKKGLPVWSLLVGEGPERRAIEDYCKTEGVTNSVLTGFVNQAGIASYYAASDALALTSEREPYGLVVSEGAAFGLPAIVSDRVGCVGPQDVARPGANALVFECGKREQLRGHIETLYRKRDLYAQMSAEAARIAQRMEPSNAAEALAEAAAALRQLGPRRRA